MILDKNDVPFTASDSIQDIIYPYPNLSSWCISDWFWRQGETKLKAGLKSLINDIIMADNFDREDLQNIAWDSIDSKLVTEKGASKKSLANG